MHPKIVLATAPPSTVATFSADDTVPVKPFIVLLDKQWARLNGGHEALLANVSDVLADGHNDPGRPDFFAAVHDQYRDVVLAVTADLSSSAAITVADFDSVVVVEEVQQVFAIGKAKAGGTSSYPRLDVRQSASAGFARAAAAASTTSITTQTNAPWDLDRIDQISRPRDGAYSYGQTGAGVDGKFLRHDACQPVASARPPHEACMHVPLDPCHGCTVYIIDSGINPALSEVSRATLAFSVSNVSDEFWLPFEVTTCVSNTTSATGTVVDFFLTDVAGLLWTRYRSCVNIGRHDVRRGEGSQPDLRQSTGLLGRRQHIQPVEWAELCKNDINVSILAIAIAIAIVDTAGIAAAQLDQTVNCQHVRRRRVLASHKRCRRGLGCQ